MWWVASLEKIEVNSGYSGSRVILGLAVSAAMTSLVVMVSLAIRGEPAGINQEL